MSFWDSLGMTPSQASGDIGGAGMAIGAAGTAASMFEGMQASSSQAAGYQNQMNMASLDMQVNNQRQQQMQLTSQRQGVENLRNTQKAKAMGMAAATNQGAQFGSGLAGAQASQTAQGGYNQLGINQNLQIGQNIFGLDNQIDQQKIAYAQNESAANTSKGMASLFGGGASLGMDLLKAAPTLALL